MWEWKDKDIEGECDSKKKFISRQHEWQQESKLLHEMCIRN
jgi:hypothetical protein